MPRPPLLRRCLLALLVLTLASASALAQGPDKAAIATAHPDATHAAREILQAGGNAFDAAVAASAALAVVEPYGSGIGGGGFWLLHQAAKGRTVMVDGREEAPGAATPDMYQVAAEKGRPKASLEGPLSAGIPGEPAALAHIAERYGELPLARSLAPAIRLAREGFEIDSSYQRMAAFRSDLLSRYPASRRTFLVDGKVPELGYRLKQPGLARTLEALAERGRDGFYEGPVAQALVDAVQDNGGIWTLDDLANYQVVEREPVRFDYGDIAVSAAAPPSAGGISLATMLNILEGYPLDELDGPARSHLIVEAMRRAYRDRGDYLGDPDFVDVPRERLTSETYAAKLRKGIDPERASDSAELPERPAKGRDTTHFSIIDAEGNRVAATLSINYPFGSGFVAADTGVVLNDEMDDFATNPGEPNAYGLVGGRANAIAPGKRPLSSMTPTFVETEERLGILGTPGGSRIITMVLLGILEFAGDEPVTEWVGRPRFHHQYLPDEIEHEPGAFTPEEIDALEAMGHTLDQVWRRYGDMQAIHWDKASGELSAASDPRGQGLAIVIETVPDSSK